MIFATLPKSTNATLDLNGFNQQIGSLSVGTAGGTPDYSNYSIVNGGSGVSTLTVSGAITPAQPFGGVISDGIFAGRMAIVKDGPNTLNLTGFNGYTGGTTVNGGTLLLNNPSAQNSASGFGPVTVNNAGTLGGLGWAGSDATIHAGGTLAPGNLSQPGTLHFSTNLTLGASSSVNFDFGSGTKDQCGVSNTLTLPNSGQVTINLMDSGSLSGSTPLFTYGSLGNTFSASQLVIGQRILPTTIRSLIPPAPSMLWPPTA